MSTATDRPAVYLTPTAGDTVGRFVLQRVLGRGAQATVWLAQDPHLQREVALKIMDPSMAQEDVDHWLQEARLMGTLAHPGILTVHEAASDGARHYLVLEFIDGQSLSERLKRKGALPAREAAELMRSVMDALALAHAQGVVHRDLKPSNILVASQAKVCKVMDFGIAARASAEHDGRIVGTPGYISPEAATGAPPTPLMDIFAAGMVLAHLLLGHPLRHDRDPMRALNRARTEQVSWPDTDAARAIDDNLRAIVMQAVVRDPAGRLPSAVAMRDALDRWLTPPAVPEAHFGATLDYLLQRMRATGEFPALSESVMGIQRVAAAEGSGLPELTCEIQKDVGLTHKLLRMVNSAQFRGSRDEVSSVARAASLVGFSAIRNMALSVKLLEHMSDARHAEQMRGLFMRALLSASIVDELTPPSAQREDAFLLGMLTQLGRLMVAYYFPTEARQIAQRLPADATPEAEQVAVREVLGTSYEDLGQGIAKAWGLADNLRAMMRRPCGDAPGAAVADPAERMRWRLRLADEMAELVLTEPTCETLGSRAEALAQRYAAAIESPPSLIRQAVKSAQTHIRELASHFRFKRKPVAESAAATLTARSLTAGTAHAREVLGGGIASVTAAMAADDFKLNEVLRQILLTMQHALALQRVVFALRDARSGLLMGRMGVGMDVDAWCRRIVVDLNLDRPDDLVTAACLKGSDTLITDARSPRLVHTLPTWLRSAPPRSFLLLPLAMKGQTFGLFYADRERAPALALAPRELELLGTLRNQAVTAFKARR